MLLRPVLLCMAKDSRGSFDGAKDWNYSWGIVELTPLGT